MRVLMVMVKMKKMGDCEKRKPASRQTKRYTHSDARVLIEEEKGGQKEVRIVSKKAKYSARGTP